MLINRYLLRYPLRKEEGGEEAGGAGGGEGGAGSDDKDDDKDQGKGKTVAWQDHQRALADLHKNKDEAKKLREELKKRDEQKLKETNDWKSLAEKYQGERDEAKTESERTSSAFKNTLRAQKVQALAEKAGLRTEARDDLDLLDLDGVEVDVTESGRYLIKGADSFVESLKKSKPHWFKAATAPKFNSGGGKSGASDDDGPIDAQKVASIERKFGRNSAEFKKAHGDWVKSLSGAKKK